MRFLSCASDASGGTKAADLFLQRFPRSLSAPMLREKAAVPPGTTTAPDWGGRLLPPALFDALMQTLQRQSALARAGLLRVPFNVPIPTMSAAPSFAWVPESGLKPVARQTFNDAKLSSAKFAGIVVLSEELVRLTSGGEGVMSAALTNAATEFLDTQFLDPTVAAVAGKNPASITNGLTPLTAATIPEAISKVLAALRPGTTKPVIFLSPAAAGLLPAYPSLTVVPTIGAKANIIGVDGGSIVYADSGGEIDVSKQADVILDSAPVAGASTVVSSLWQLNLRGFRVDRFVNWNVTAANAVAYATLS